MIMWEILTSEPLIIDREYDQYLMDICLKELRSPILKYVPESYVTLMKQCTKIKVVLVLLARK